MNYSVFLGPDKRHIPDGKWDTYKAAGELHLYDLVFKRHPQGLGWYSPVLTDGTETFKLGIVMKDSFGHWSCIPNPSYCDKKIVDGIQIGVRMISQKGFATRLAAAQYLMRRQGFTNPEEWC